MEKWWSWCSYVDEEFTLKNWEESIFCNRIILRRILCFLDLADIKCLRLVSWNISNSVSSEVRLGRDNIFVVCESSIEHGLVASSVHTLWQSIRLELHEGIGCVPADRKNIHKLISAAERLEVTLDGNMQHQNINTNNKIVHLPLLNQWAHAHPSSYRFLKEIQINILILGYFKVDNSILSNAFPTISNLVMYYSKIQNPVVHKNAHNPKDSQKPCLILDNFKYIGGMCRNLKELSIGSVCCSLDYWVASLLAKLGILLQNILPNNFRTLTTLTVQDSSLRIFKKLLVNGRVVTTLPHLKNIHLRYEPSETNTIVKILSRQLSIQNLSLSSKFILPAVADVLGQITAEGQHMKKLCLAAQLIGDTDNVDTVWGFLKNLRGLQEFSWIEPRSKSRVHLHSHSVSDVLNVLPKTLSKLKLWGLLPPRKIMETEMENPIIDMVCVGYGNWWSDSNFLYDFPLLTELSLLHCLNCLNDEALQWICTSMTQLVRLEFSHCSLLSDYGITGRNTSSRALLAEPTSIKNIRGLRILTIRNCYRITNAVLNAISFQDLTLLNLGNNNKIQVNIDLIDNLLIQNPNLEKLFLSAPQPISKLHEEELFGHRATLDSEHSRRYNLLGYVDADWELIKHNGDGESSELMTLEPDVFLCNCQHHRYYEDRYIKNKVV